MLVASPRNKCHSSNEVTPWTGCWSLQRGRETPPACALAEGSLSRHGELPGSRAPVCLWRGRHPPLAASSAHLTYHPRGVGSSPSSENPGIERVPGRPPSGRRVLSRAALTPAINSQFISEPSHSPDAFLLLRVCPGAPGDTTTGPAGRQQPYKSPQQ